MNLEFEELKREARHVKTSLGHHGVQRTCGRKTVNWIDYSAGKAPSTVVPASVKAPEQGLFGNETVATHGFLLNFIVSKAAGEMGLGPAAWSKAGSDHLAARHSSR